MVPASPLGPVAALNETLSEVMDLRRTGGNHRQLSDAVNVTDRKEQAMTQTATRQPAPPPPLASVADVMRPPLTTADTNDHAAAAAYLMKDARATALMVLDTQAGQPKGILTEADIAHAVADGKDLNEIRIRELTTIRPTVKPATTVRDAAQIMTRGHFRHLPVSGDSGLAGIIDITDICRALIGPDIPRRPGADATPAQTV
jgi:CBS domain-containing protein